MHCCSQTTGDLPPGPFAHRQYSIFLQIYIELLFLVTQVFNSYNSQSLVPCLHVAMSWDYVHPYAVSHILPTCTCKGIRSMYITFIYFHYYNNSYFVCRCINSLPIQCEYKNTYVRTAYRSVFAYTYMRTYVRTYTHSDVPYVHTYIGT